MADGGWVFGVVVDESANEGQRKALADPQVREKFFGLGQDIPEPAQQTAQALRAHHEAEIKLWWPLIKAANIKIE